MYELILAINIIEVFIYNVALNALLWWSVGHKVLDRRGISNLTL